METVQATIDPDVDQVYIGRGEVTAETAALALTFDESVRLVEQLQGILLVVRARLGER